MAHSKKRVCALLWGVVDPSAVSYDGFIEFLKALHIDGVTSAIEHKEFCRFQLSHENMTILRTH